MKKKDFLFILLLICSICTQKTSFAQDESINPLSGNEYNGWTFENLIKDGFSYDQDEEVYSKKTPGNSGVVFLKYYDNRVVEKQRKFLTRDQEERREYHENGVLKIVQKYAKVKDKWEVFGITRVYHDNGVLYMKGSMKHGLPEGEVVVYDHMGVRLRTELYRAGKLISTLEDIKKD